MTSHHRIHPLRLLRVRAPRCGFILLALLMGTVMLCGCGSSNEATVSGTVTLDGQPMDRGHGVVTFHPVGAGALAYGQIDPDGKYTIRTGRTEGLVAGEYAITVQVTVMHDPPGGDPNVEPLPELITPARYSDPKASGLRETVEPGHHRVDLKLTSDRRPR